MGSGSVEEGVLLISGGNVYPAIRPRLLECERCRIEGEGGAKLCWC